MTQSHPSSKEVHVDRRNANDRRQSNIPVANERRKKPRRRQIDPTTCERDYSGDEIEFMHALDDYKRRSGRMFPTCSEILEVLRELGYAKVVAETASEASPAANEPASEADNKELAELEEVV